MIRLGGVIDSEPARKAGDPGSNPGPDDNFLLKLSTRDLPDGYSDNQIVIIYYV